MSLLSIFLLLVLLVACTWLLRMSRTYGRERRTWRYAVADANRTAGVAAIIAVLIFAVLVGVRT
jgi:uncharacterized membrane protein